jgi:flagellar biogenesis protein FliO
MKKIEISNGTVVNWLIIAILIIAIFAIYTLGGCMSAKKINKFKQIYCTDSVTVQIKDNIVKVPVYYSDSAFMDLFLECDSCGTVYFNSWQEANGKYIELKKKLEGNKLTVVSYVHIHDTVQVITHDTIVKERVKVKEVTNEVGMWQRAKIWLSGALIGAVFAVILFLFYRFKNKIIGIFKK